LSANGEAVLVRRSTIKKMIILVCTINSLLLVKPRFTMKLNSFSQNFDFLEILIIRIILFNIDRQSPMITINKNQYPPI
jgi:hypothetical protein